MRQDVKNKMVENLKRNTPSVVIDDFIEYIIDSLSDFDFDDFGLMESFGDDKDLWVRVIPIKDSSVEMSMRFLRNEDGGKNVLVTIFVNKKLYVADEYSSEEVFSNLNVIKDKLREADNG